MKKETVVRQNRCDREMNFLLFGCFVLFMGMQLFVGETQQSGIVNAVNMALYLVFVPGFMLHLGYCFEREVRTGTMREAKMWLIRTAARCYGYFLLLALGQDLCQKKLTVNYSITSILAVTEIPAVSAIFFSMALTLVLIWIFYDKITTLMRGTWQKTAVFAAVCLLCAFLRTKGETYAFLASLTGSDVQQAVPAVPYFAFFLAGVWLEKKKPAIQWKLLAVSAGVTAVSLLLYRTPLRALCRVTASCLPVYLVYGASEYLTEVTLRLRAAKRMSAMTEYVFLGCSALLFALSYTGMLAGAGMKKTLAVTVAAAVVSFASVFVFSVSGKICGAACDYFEKKVRRKTAVYFLIYTAAFFVLFAIVFSDFIRQNKSFVWMGDGVTQYYPRAVYFSRYIRKFLSGLFHGNVQLPMYDFRVGLGSEITYSLEPLYFLFALFGEEHAELAYNLITILRFYLVGIASSALFLYFNKKYFPAFMGTIVYVFCGFALYGGAKHTMFMIPMIMLPLLIIAVEEIMRKKRWYLCTIFVAVSLFSNYYYLFMNTIAMGIYFLVRFFCQKEKKKKTFKNFMADGLMIAGTYLLGVAMSCIVLVTTFGMYLGSGRTGDVRISTPSLFYYSAERLVRCFLTFLTTANSPGDWLKFGYLPIALFAVVFLFLRKGRKELKVLAAVSWVLLMLPLSGFVFSGFSAIVNRWCYMVSLLVGYIVAACLPEMMNMTKRELRICAAVLAVYGYLAFFGDLSITFSTRYTKLAFVLLAVTFVVLLVCQKQNLRMTHGEKRSLLILLTAVILFAQGHTEFAMNNELKPYVEQGKTKKLIRDTPLRAVKKAEDDSFFRSAVTKLDYLTSSASIIEDYNSVTTVCSTLNGNVMEYLEKMGCTTYSVTQLMGLGSRAFIDSLASVKYYAYFGRSPRPVPYGYKKDFRTKVNHKNTMVKKSPYAMPLGYTYSDVISESELEQYSVEERPEVLMQRAALADEAAEEFAQDAKASQDAEKLQNAENGAPVITGEKLEFTSYDANRVKLKKHTLKTDPSYKNHSVKLRFDGKPKSETYLVLKNAVLENGGESVVLTAKAAGSSVQYNFASEDYRYGSGQKDFVINLGYHKNPVKACKLLIRGAGTIRFDSMEIYSQPMEGLKQYAGALTEDVLENAEIGMNAVSGSISLAKDKMLVLSIPYQKGWTAYVDGEKKELLRANYMYMGLPLEAGEHEVRLEFEIPGVYLALKIMASAAGLFVVLLLVSFVRRKKKR